MHTLLPFLPLPLEEDFLVPYPMTDLHQIFDSLVGYLVGMTFVEVILKPLLVRNGQKLIRAVDQDPALPDWVIPDFLHSELEKEGEQEE